MVADVLDYFKKEHENGGQPLYKANAVILTTSQATGVSISSVQRIAKRKDEPLMTPGKKHPSRKPRFGKLDSFDLGVIRRIIHQFYLQNEVPTLKKILKELRQKMDFPYKKSILAELLKEMGFVYKTRERDRIMYEREDIIAWRQRYLRKMMEIRKSVSLKTLFTWMKHG